MMASPVELGVQPRRTAQTRALDTVPQGKKRQSNRRKPIPISAEIMDVLVRQSRAFAEKFGREWGPEDPLFFDPTCDTPRPMTDDVLDHRFREAMDVVKIRPAIIYAYQKTGLHVTRENAKDLSLAERTQWIDAMSEWYRLHPDVVSCRGIRAQPVFPAGPNPKQS
jgi:hypothetical protein